MTRLLFGRSARDPVPLLRADSWRRSLRLYAPVFAVGVGGSALVHWNRTPDDPPWAVLYVAAVLLGFLVAHRVLDGEDPILLPTTALLVAVGLVMVFRLQPHGLAYHAAWTCAGLGGLVAACRVPSCFRWPQAATAAALLLGSVAPWAWQALPGGWQLAAGDLVTQLGSEVAKVCVVVWAASELKHGRIRGPAVAVWATAVALWLVRGQVATAAVLVWVGLAVAYCAGPPVRALALVAGGFVVLAGLVHASFPHLVDRVAGWANPWADPMGAGYPLVQSLFAVAAGGLVGSGPGAGYPELVPEAHTSQTLAAVAEEWGFVGVVGLVCAYAVWVGRMLRLAVRARRIWSRWAAVGAASLVAGQVFLSGAGCTGLLPHTEAALPFVSTVGVSVAGYLILLGVVVGSGQVEEGGG
ncbi:MAG: FtsW/RodA/SpoVE family cell cycle protein [Armatimonadota bacterium]|nr:FtsW/RodA/SpoVE family cell cycle protein [Armatimonadota bacterium]MDW8156899.1 FtsW/RodA/SpoVE family cell cycle protein [Armatimonadota bacterium]